MTHRDASEHFRSLPREAKERLFLDVLGTPPFGGAGTWGERFHYWLEEQAAEGLPLGQIARRMDLPWDRDEATPSPWRLLDAYVAWMIAGGFGRVVRIEVVA
jgi:hypothetical protein